MTDYRTEFAAFLPLNPAQEIAFLAVLRERERKDFHAAKEELDEDTSCYNYAVSFQIINGVSGVWVDDDTFGGCVDDLVDMVRETARRAPTPGRWGFAWAHTCSEKRINEFGGGACVIDMSTGDAWWLSLEDWVVRQCEATGDEAVNRVYFSSAKPKGE